MVEILHTSIIDTYLVSLHAQPVATSAKKLQNNHYLSCIKGLTTFLFFSKKKISFPKSGYTATIYRLGTDYTNLLSIGYLGNDNNGSGV